MRRKNTDGVKILFITPLRALNRDLFKRLIDFSRLLGISIDIRHGDTSLYRRHLHLKKPPDVLITTPESLQALMAAPKMRLNLTNIEIVIIDEIHELINNKRGAQLSLGLERLRRLSGKDFQTIGLSATIDCPNKILNFLKGSSKRSLELVKSNKEREFKVKINTSVLRKIKENELELFPIVDTTIEELEKIANLKKGVIFFVNTRLFAEALSSRFLGKSNEIKIHHSSLSRELRITTEDDFKRGKIKGIVATSSLELGIDIGNIDYVVQVGSPRMVTKFLQRIGRAQHIFFKPAIGEIITLTIEDLLESIAIVNLAIKERIESCRFYKKALDVLAHQIVGLILEYKKMSVDEIWNLVKDSYSFNNLEYNQFLRLVYFLNTLKYIRIAKNTYLQPTKRSREYYYTNITTIDDSPKYMVVDINENKNLGMIDYEYVVKELYQGKSFVIAGKKWNVIEIDDEKTMIKVTQTFDENVEIVRWEGEQIPVSYEVAQEVKNIIASFSKNKQSINDVLNYVDDKSYLINILENIKKYWNTIITNYDLFVEYGDGICVLYTFFGSKINYTLGLLLSALLTSRLGKDVTFATDPYRIFLNIREKAHCKYVVELLNSLKPGYIEELTKKIISRTGLFLWRLSNVCKRFGIIKREMHPTKGFLMSVLDAYQGTPLLDETFNEIFQRDLDVEGLKNILVKIIKGKIKILDKVIPISFLTKNTTTFYKSRISTNVGKEKEIVNIIKKRLEKRELSLVCLNCYKWVTRKRVEFMNDEIICPYCGSKFIGISKRNINTIKGIIKKIKNKVILSSEERKIYYDLVSSANLTVNYGKIVAYAIAGEGIGVRTAIRVINRSKGDFEKLIKEIIEAEKMYAKTKRFWT